MEAPQKQQCGCSTWGLTCVRGCWYDSGDAGAEARFRSLLVTLHAGVPVSGAVCCVLVLVLCNFQAACLVWYLCGVERVRSSPRATVTTASSPSAGQNASSPHPVCVSISAMHESTIASRCLGKWRAWTVECRVRRPWSKRVCALRPWQTSCLTATLRIQRGETHTQRLHCTLEAVYAVDDLPSKLLRPPRWRGKLPAKAHRGRDVRRATPTMLSLTRASEASPGAH